MTQSARAVNTRTPITVNGCTVGTVVDHEFQKTIHEYHFLKKPPAIAFECASLDAAERVGATFAVITCSESRATYVAPIRMIREHGFSFNRGFGLQIALPLDYWSINGQAPTAQPQKPPKAAQLGLFGDAD
ncbi:hypothetical protein BH10CHL1_BH10CHL1_01620 [soil metagenome]